jgi:hypothetical protein
MRQKPIEGEASHRDAFLGVSALRARSRQIAAGSSSFEDLTHQFFRRRRTTSARREFLIRLPHFSCQPLATCLNQPLAEDKNQFLLVFQGQPIRSLKDITEWQGLVHEKLHNDWFSSPMDSIERPTPQQL